MNRGRTDQQLVMPMVSPALTHSLIHTLPRPLLPIAPTYQQWPLELLLENFPVSRVLFRDPRERLVHHHNYLHDLRGLLENLEQGFHNHG